MFFHRSSVDVVKLCAGQMFRDRPFEETTMATMRAGAAC